MLRITGTYERTNVAEEEVSAFVPYPLPPSDPPIEMGHELAGLHDRAQQSLARLELAGEMVPSIEWFIYAFVHKEAVLSSQIEGTQATLIDLLNFEADQTVADSASAADIQAVCNYLDALTYARDELHTEHGLPLSIRLLNQAHRILMRGVRGERKSPGEIRISQNWIGGTRPGNAVFVPPPPQHLGDLLQAFEVYLHDDEALPPLVRTALLHVQFETIHPYLDGNGRIGRLLITLLLEQYGLLSKPLLYLSLYFRRHQEEYYRLLGTVRHEGDWESWAAFFLEGVATIANEAADSARDLFTLLSDDRQRVLHAPSTTLMAARLLEQLPEHPVVTISQVAKLLGTTKPTANKAVSVLVDAEVLNETSGRKRGQMFAYKKYLDRLRADIEL